MGKTTNILDLNNRLTKVEKENVAQNSYTSLKNKPKINSVTLTGNKSLADIGAAAAADVDKLNVLNSRVMTSGNSYVQSVNFPCRNNYGCVSINAFVQQYGSVIFDVLVMGGNIVTKDRITGLAISDDIATFAINNGVLTITFSNEATYTATFQTPYI